MPITSFLDVMNHDALRSDNRIFGFFLYTEADKKIAKYAKNNFYELNAMSSECLLFYIERPTFLKKYSLSREYHIEYGKFHPTFPSGMSSETKPYDRTQVYEIAKKLKISIDKIPCIVFFQNLDSNSIIVYPLKNKWTDEEITTNLRKIFSIIDKYDKNTNYESRGEKIWESLKKFVEDESPLIPEIIFIYLGLTMGGIARGLASL